MLMYFLIALPCEVKHALRTESELKKLPIAHQLQADLVSIPSDKAPARQCLHRMAYETSAQRGQTAPSTSVILIALQAKLTALSLYSFLLPHRPQTKPSNVVPRPSSTFHGSALFVPTLYQHEAVLRHC